MHSLFVRATGLAMLAGALFVPASALAAPAADPGTGTLIGTITCGPSEDSPAAHIEVTAPGSGVQTLTDGTGSFVLVGVPAQQTFRVQATADPDNLVVTSRYNVSLQPGETLDVGSMDLAICGQPQQPAPVQNDQPADFSQNG